MDRRILTIYNRELQHLRETAGEFAREFPKIAGRLSLDEFECADPYVERLLEGFAFLAARVQLKYEAEFPRFTQSIIETVYPHYLAPTPSMAVVQFQPDMAEKALADGFRIRRGEAMRSIIGKDDRTACEYRTAHDVTLWPVRVTQARYYTRELASLDLPESTQARAGIGLRLETAPGLVFSDLGLDSLTFFIRGANELPMRLYEQVMGHATGLALQPPAGPAPWRRRLGRESIRPVGFEASESLLPPCLRSFQGYQHIHEYFTFPARYMFFECSGLREAVRQCKGNQLDLILLTDQVDLELEDRVDVSNFALFCTPAVNLFPKRTDRVQLSDQTEEYHVIPDRTRPLDFEVYRVTQATGHGMKAGDEQEFLPFYLSSDFDAGAGGGSAYYAVNRQSRLSSQNELSRGRRSSYGGSEVYLSLVDARNAPYRSELRELAVQALCTNRDLPLQIPIGRGQTDFTLDTSTPVAAVRCLAGPTPPRPSFAEGETAWRAISHLSLNYLSLVDSPGGSGASALRELLKLYGDAGDAQIRKQIEGLISVSSQPVTRRIRHGGPIAFARGVEVTLTFDEGAFEGTGCFLLGSVLERFLSKYVSINSFVETVVCTKQRGEIMRWLPREGTRHIL